MYIFRYLQGVVTPRAWLALPGLCLLLLGCLGFTLAFPLGVAATLGLGGFLMLQGLFRLSDPVGRGWKTRDGLVLGTLFLGGGLALFQNPVQATFILTGLLGVALVVAGLLKGFMHYCKDTGREFVIPGLAPDSPALFILLGSLILLSWPGSAFWVIGLLVAIEMLLGGLASVTASLRPGD